MNIQIGPNLRVEIYDGYVRIGDHREQIGVEDIYLKILIDTLEHARRRMKSLPNRHNPETI